MGVNQDLYKVGKNFRVTYSKAGAPSLKKRMIKASILRGGSLRGFTKDDIQLVSGIVKKSEKRIRRKGFMTKYRVKKDKQELFKEYKKKNISLTTYKKGKKFIDHLGKAGQEENKEGKKIKFYRRPYLEDEASPHAKVGVSSLGTKHVQARATGVAHGYTGIGQIINKPKPMKPLGISARKPISSNFRMKI